MVDDIFPNCTVYNLHTVFHRTWMNYHHQRLPLCYITYCLNRMIDGCGIVKMSTSKIDLKRAYNKTYYYPTDCASRPQVLDLSFEPLTTFLKQQILRTRSRKLQLARDLGILSKVFENFINSDSYKLQPRQSIHVLCIFCGTFICYELRSDWMRTIIIYDSS